MRISFNTCINKTTSFNCTKNTQKPHISSGTFEDNLMCTNAIYFRGQLQKPETISYTDIPIITSEAEYDDVLNRLKNDRTWWPGWSHGRATKFEQGILPYAGEQDRSVVINTFMRNGHIVDPRFSESILRDYVRVMDYALKEFDKTYGKYEGLVYRCGIMDNPPKNYISTSREPEGLTAIINSKDCYHNPFYIIYTKHGHKIEEMQKKLCSNPMLRREREIILDPARQYEEITDITPEMQELKNNLRLAIRDDYGYVPELNTIFYREV